MKSRTLISFCQRPVLNRYHGDVAASVFVSRDAMTSMKALSFDDRRTLSAGLDQPEQHSSVPGDDELLVRGNHPGRHAASGSGDPLLSGAVRVDVQLDAEPR